MTANQEAMLRNILRSLIANRFLSRIIMCAMFWEKKNINQLIDLNQYFQPWKKISFVAKKKGEKNHAKIFFLCLFSL